MLIALDYDDTYTRDPEFWDKFIQDCRARDHQIVVATMRYGYECEPLLHLFANNVDCIVATGRRAKRPYLATLGLIPAVWIDDEPSWIITNALGHDQGEDRGRIK